jgi:DNA-binding winged helix-turn-helix (wHTH) protein
MPVSGLNVMLGQLLRPEAPAPARLHLEPAVDAGHKAQSLWADRLFSAQRTEPIGGAPIEISFGPFRLLPTRFLLLEGDRSVSLGSRALAILIALLERPGQLISKKELMARVWPNIFVAPANLTVHMSALRRALRDGRDGNRFIINVPGRGYSFVTDVTASIQPPSTHATDIPTSAAFGTVVNQVADPHDKRSSSKHATAALSIR